MLLNNLRESFNSAIFPARDKPIVTLLEKVRFWLMCRFATKRGDVEKWVHPIGNRIRAVIEKYKNTARYCQSTLAGNAKFQVTFLGAESFVVDLRSKTCTCRSFQLNGIPCPHALACIWASGLDAYDFVDDWYKKEAYVAAYSGIIEPMTSPDKWPEPGLNPIQPPPEISLPGRPKKKRNKINDEIPPGFERELRQTATKHHRRGQVNHCSKCGQTGHKRVTCPNPVSDQVSNCLCFF